MQLNTLNLEAEELEAVIAPRIPNHSETFVGAAEFKAEELEAVIAPRIPNHNETFVS
jgi:hypothetical protein